MRLQPLNWGGVGNEKCSLTHDHSLLCYSKDEGRKFFCIYILQSSYHDGTPFSRQGGYTQGHKNVCLQNYSIPAFLWRIQSTPYKPSLFQDKNIIDDVSVLICTSRVIFYVYGENLIQNKLKQGQGKK